jgi:lysophospholipase L1-like esterase
MNIGLWRQIALGMMTLLLGFSGPPAWSQVETHRSSSFGDSLTDNEFLYLIFDTASEIYGADPFEAMFDKASGPEDELTNYAVLGSTSADVLRQIKTYAIGRLAKTIDRSTLVSIQAGGNDFLDPGNLMLLAAAPPGVSLAVDSIVDRIRLNLLKSVQTIKSIDKAQVIVWTVPDVTLTPYAQFIGLGGVAAENVRLHIEKLNRFIRTMAHRKQIAVLDISSVFTEVVLNPPVIAGIPLVPPPYFGESFAIFADPLHPTAVSNGITANAMIHQANTTFNDSIPLYSEAELADMAGLLAAP